MPLNLKGLSSAASEGITPSCPECGKMIPAEDVNVAKDVAFCRACNQAHSLSALAHGTAIQPGVDTAHPPAGAWYTSNGMGTIIGATHRSCGAAGGTLFITVFWNGIVSVFVCLAIAGTLRNLDLPMPSWFPAPHMNGAPMSWLMTLFLWLFLTPFIAVGLAMLGAFLSAIGGRTEVRIRNREGIVFTGIGPLGLRKRFDAGEVDAVRIEEEPYTTRSGTSRNRVRIVLQPRQGKLIKFGASLNEERRQF